LTYGHKLVPRERPEVLPIAGAFGDSGSRYDSIESVGRDPDHQFQVIRCLSAARCFP